MIVTIYPFSCENIGVFSFHSKVIFLIFQEDAEHRKKELEKMLDEHQEIVQEIGRSSSRDNLAEDNRDH